MKVKFTRSATYVPEWNGNKELPEKEQISVDIRPMEFGDLLEFFDAIGGAQAAMEGSTQLDTSAILKIAPSVLSKYVDKVENLEDGDGPVQLHDLMKYPVFMGLASEIIMEIAKISTPQEEAEKN